MPKLLGQGVLIWKVHPKDSRLLQHINKKCFQNISITSSAKLKKEIWKRTFALTLFFWAWISNDRLFLRLMTIYIFGVKSLTLNHNILSLLQFRNFKQSVYHILSGLHMVQTSRLTLTLNHMIWRSNGLFYCLQPTTVCTCTPNVATFRQNNNTLIKTNSLTSLHVWPQNEFGYCLF